MPSTLTSTTYSERGSATSTPRRVNQYSGQACTTMELVTRNGTVQQPSHQVSLTSSQTLRLQSSDVIDDATFVERRRKNNEAAKRSRDARRLKERQTQLRAATLEQENVRLRTELAVLRNQSAKLHCLLYNKFGV